MSLVPPSENIEKSTELLALHAVSPFEGDVSNFVDD